MLFSETGRDLPPLTRRQMLGRFANGWFLLITGWSTCLLITALDLYALPETVQKAWAVIAGP